MLFHSYSFLFLFLPVALLLVRGVRPPLRNWVLPFSGVAFYCVRGATELALLVGMTLLTFLATRSLGPNARTARPRLALLVVALQLGVLLGIKLAYGSGVLAGVALPLGISFYTFNLVSYALDVNAARATPGSLSSLLAFATFFPTLASGPLLRFADFEAQRREPAPLDAELVEAGLLGLIVGLAKKLLVADPLGAAIEPLFSDFQNLGFADAWLAVMGYAYQLYFDFSGYSDMAIGMAALIGIRVPQNFNAPYAAAHIADFWQRWHITMSRWFRDYLFLPLSRAVLRRRVALEGADSVRSACLIATMVAIGLWHGATWAFLAWGLYNGLLLAGHARLRQSWRAPIPAWAARAVTFAAVLVGWVLLKSPSPEMAVRIWQGMLGLHGWGRPLGGSYGWLAVAVAVLLVVTNSSLEAYLLRPQRTRLQSWALATLLVLGLLLLGARSPFLYFRF